MLLGNHMLSYISLTKYRKKNFEVGMNAIIYYFQFSYLPDERLSL